jgi:hypothetical protein
MVHKINRQIVCIAAALISGASMASPAFADSEAGFMIMGGGSESGGFLPIGSAGTGSESGGATASGASSDSGGVFQSGAESDSGGIAEVGSSTQSGGTDASSESGGLDPAAHNLQYGIKYYNW